MMLGAMQIRWLFSRAIDYYCLKLFCELQDIIIWNNEIIMELMLTERAVKLEELMIGLRIYR